MSWNYRVVQESHQHRGHRETSYSVREVYYDKGGKVNGYGQDAIKLSGFKGKDDLIASLGMIIKDVATRSILKLSHKKERLYERGMKP